MFPTKVFEKKIQIFAGKFYFVKQIDAKFSEKKNFDFFCKSTEVKKNAKFWAKRFPHFAWKP